MLSMEAQEQIKRLNEENAYLKTKLSVHESGKNRGGKNIGEKDEILFLMDLFRLNQTKEFAKLVDIFGDEASEGVRLLCMETREIITDVSSISKTSSMFKADCMFVMTRTNKTYKSSIKSKNGGKPSIMNHRRRDNLLFQPQGALYSILPDIDALVLEYHTWRRDHVLPEEVFFRRINNLITEQSRKTLKELVWFFMFKDTGNKESDADSLIVIHGDENEFINIGTKEEQMNYIEAIWDQFDLSLVSRKGTKFRFKDEYENNLIKDPTFETKYEQMKPWIYETTDNGRNNPENKIKMKAALHIRWK